MCADIVKQGEEIISVGQLNQQAKNLLENQFKGIAVIGEISNFHDGPLSYQPMSTANPALVGQIGYTDWLVTQKTTEGS